MKMITVEKYENVDFVWVADHWDYHLTGICKYNGKLCEFRMLEMNYPPACVIYSLSIFEKIKWIIDKTLFEGCVGYHYTYPHRTNGEVFKYRKPQWLFKLLFELYYLGRK